MLVWAAVHGEKQGKVHSKSRASGFHAQLILSQLQKRGGFQTKLERSFKGSSMKFEDHLPGCWALERPQSTLICLGPTIEPLESQALPTNPQALASADSPAAGSRARHPPAAPSALPEASAGPAGGSETRFQP